MSDTPEIEEIPIHYRTPDGHEFPTRAEAGRHAAVKAAAEAYDKAHAGLVAALLETQKTADGEPFRLSYYSTFWLVWGHINGGPGVKEITLKRGAVEFDDNDDARVVVWEQNRDGSYRRLAYPISDLYAHRPSALRAWLAKARETADWAQSLAKEIETKVKREGAL